MISRKSPAHIIFPLSLLLSGCNLFLDLSPIPNDTDLDPSDTQIELDVGLDMASDVGLDTAADMTPDMGPVLRPIGPRPVLPTPLGNGTLFAAPSGTGTTCSDRSPCDVYQAASQAIPSDVVFLKGGEYQITKNLNLRGGNPPVVFESYPNEEAILDGSTLTASDDVTILVDGGPVVMRRMTVRNMPRVGISVPTSDNLFEGLNLHGNQYNGIQVYGSADTPVSNRNIIRDSVIWNSGSDGKADGIAISSGAENRVENCLVYANTDDGIDIWRSIDTYIGYSIVHSNGGVGNGHGVKAGGNAPSARAVVEHNLSYGNLGDGFTFDSGADVTFRHNTSWDNALGFQVGSDTLTTKNISFDEPAQNGGGNQIDNSWQRSGTPTPLSTDPDSLDFLVPSGTGFTDIGAHSNRD